MRRPLVRLVAGAAFCIAFHGPAASATTAGPTGAEFAIRWNARDGGPKTGVETLAVLNARARRTRHFKVDYFDLPSVATVPQDFSTILRRRVEDDGRTQLTWKLRGDRALAQWTCPLRKPRQTKAEVDITFGGGDRVARMYSYSCTSEDTNIAAHNLSADIKGCTAEVRRWEAGRLKIEEWKLPGDVLIIEVSGGGTDTPGAIEHFRRQVAAPLFAAGIVSSKQSKTELGTRCK
jgi:hypothetical protein